MKQKDVSRESRQNPLALAGGASNLAWYAGAREFLPILRPFDSVSCL